MAKKKGGKKGAKKKGGKNALVVTANAVLKRTWNGTLVKSKIALVTTPRTRMNSKGMLTTADEMRPHMMRLGGPLKYGSLTAEEFCGRLTWFPETGVAASLTLMTTKRRDPLHVKNILAEINTDWWIEAAGGPFSSNDADKMAITRLMHDFHRSEMPVDDLPRFGATVQNLEVYHETMNSFWAIFYCEFYNLLNHLIRESCYLFTREMGYEWTSTGENVLRNNSFIIMKSDAGVKDKRFTEMVDAVISLVDNIVCATPCLLHPVGIQHMTPGEVFTMDINIDRCLDVLCSKNSFLGSCCSSSGEVTGKDTKPDRRNWKTKMMWKNVRNMVITLKCAFFDANCFTQLVSNFVQKELRLPDCYTHHTMDEAIAEDPINFGYRLRLIELQRNLMEGDPVQKGWIPFDFPRFAKNLASRTGVHEQDYLPPYVQLRYALDKMVNTKMSTHDYITAWNKGLGIKHENVLMNLIERMKSEHMDHPCDFYKGEISKEIDQYLPLITIIIRRKIAGERLTPQLSMVDMHRPASKMESVFAIWCSTMTAYCPDTYFKCSVVKVDHTAKFRPYETKKKPETTPAPVKPKSKFVAQVPLVAKAFRRGVIKSKWTRLSRKLTAGKQMRRMARKLMFACALERTVLEANEKRREKHVSMIADMLRVMRQTRDEERKRKAQEENKRREAQREQARKRDQEKKRRQAEKLELHKARTEAEALERKREHEIFQLRQELEQLKMSRDSAWHMNDLRKRMEFFCFVNLNRDPFLMQFFNPVTCSLPYEIFCDAKAFPSLQIPIAKIGGPPAEAIKKAIADSSLMQPTPTGIRIFF